MVKAKFKVVAKTETESGWELNLQPVIGNSEENKKFYKYTPYGEFKMGTINDEAAKYFIVGKEYYIDFNLAENG